MTDGYFQYYFLVIEKLEKNRCEMAIGLLGKKIGMTRIFDDGGTAVSVTLIEAGPCKVIQKKSKEKESYQAIQMGFEEKKENRTSQPLQGHFKKAGLKPYRFLKEFRYEEGDYEIGQVISLDIFEGVDFVDIVGVSKGRGFAGAVKRWGFHGGPATRGSMTHRILGSIGSTDSARVYKGKRMAGRMGGKQITTQSLRIIKRDAANNILVVEGAVPGPNGGILVIKKAIKRKSIPGIKKTEAVKKESTPDK